MPGRPKETKLREILLRLAHQELGEDATALEWVEGKIASGVTVTALAKVLAGEFGEGQSCSRGWISSALNRLTDDAKERIKLARKEAAGVLIDDALAITDETVRSTADVQRNRMRSDARMRIAGWWDKEQYGEAKSIALTLGAPGQHLEAMRLRALEIKALAAAPALLLAAGSDPQDESEDYG